MNAHRSLTRQVRTSYLYFSLQMFLCICVIEKQQQNIFTWSDVLDFTSSDSDRTLRLAISTTETRCVLQVRVLAMTNKYYFACWNSCYYVFCGSRRVMSSLSEVTIYFTHFTDLGHEIWEHGLSRWKFSCHFLSCIDRAIQNDFAWLSPGGNYCKTRGENPPNEARCDQQRIQCKHVYLAKPTKPEVLVLMWHFDSQQFRILHKAWHDKSDTQ